jgi:hypothetical protein
MGKADKNIFNETLTGDETWGFACDPETEKQNSKCVGEISPLTEVKDIPSVPHQDQDDKFFRLSRPSAQRIHTRGENSKCRIL